MKQKRFILTETGEVRPPDCYEYFIRTDGLPDLASYDFESGKFPILKLEAEEVEWKPKEGEMYYAVRLDHESYVIDVKCEDDEYDIACFAENNCFQTKAEAEQKLEKIKQVLRGEI